MEIWKNSNKLNLKKKYWGWFVGEMSGQMVCGELVPVLESSQSGLLHDGRSGDGKLDHQILLGIHLDLRKCT